MRNIFKSVQIQDKTYLYPTPVQKDHKYLIEVPGHFNEFFKQSFKSGILPSPDESPPWLVKDSIHSDGKTPIYIIEYEKCLFEFLPEKNKDPQKALALHKLISKKIAAVLLDQEKAKTNLAKRYQSQLACSTCQSLGIAHPEVAQWFQYLL